MSRRIEELSNEHGDSVPACVHRFRSTARIGSSRYKVIHLAAEHYQYGWTAEELLQQHSDLKPEQVYSALVYFYDHRDEMIAQIEAAAEASKEQRGRQSLSRETLLKRTAA